MAFSRELRTMRAVLRALGELAVDLEAIGKPVGDEGGEKFIPPSAARSASWSGSSREFGVAKR